MTPVDIQRRVPTRRD